MAECYLLSTTGALRSLTCVAFLSLAPFWISANRAFLPPPPPDWGLGHCQKRDKNKTKTKTCHFYIALPIILKYECLCLLEKNRKIIKLVIN